MKRPSTIPPAGGKLGILLVGMGAVATTTIAGVMLARRGMATPIGSLTQLGTIRLGKRTDARTPKIRDLVPLASLADIEFGGWDIFPDNAYEAAVRANVLEAKHLDAVREELSRITPMKGVFYQEFVPRLHGAHTKEVTTKAKAVEEIRADIRRFKAERGVDRVVVVCASSTETYVTQTNAHRDIGSFEKALASNDPSISPTQIYAWACMKEGVPFANGTPNLAVDFPAVGALARETSTPIAGKDFKTGQTLMKTIIAPGLKARLLGLRGWSSTSRRPSSRRRRRSSASSTRSSSPRRIPSSTATSSTRSASTTTRRAATRRRAGTTSISKGGSATRCR